MSRTTKQSRASEPQPLRRRRHDATYKTLGQEVLVVRDLLRNFAAKGWHHELVLPTLVSFPTETVSDDLKRRLTDVAWRVQFKDGRWLVMFFEFQSSRDPGMAVRTLLYSATVLATLQRSEELRRLRGPDGALPLVLAFVIYTGRRPWNAENAVRMPMDKGRLPPAMAQAIGGLGVHHEHALLDLLAALAQGLLPEDSVLNWLAQLEQDPWANLPRVHEAMARHWGGPEMERVSARRAFAQWTEERMRAVGAPPAMLVDIKEQIVSPTEEEDIVQTYAEWAEGHRAEGRQEGRQEGREEGGRAMLVRLVSSRFGADAGTRLAEMVRGMGGEELARVGDAVVKCRTADELLAAAASNGATQRG